MNLSELDYYNILNISRSASKEDICIAYRKLAIKLCPFRDERNAQEFVPTLPKEWLTHMAHISLKRQWAYINMAYDVLGDDLRRAIYDRYGEAGLLHGVPLPNGYFPPYLYHGDHLKVYHQVFASYSPYANVIDGIVGKLPPYYSNTNMGIGVKTKDPPIIKQIYLDLEEIYSGCKKLMQVWRQEFIDDDQLQTEKRKKTLTLNIPAGVAVGTNFCFPQEGDRMPTKIPADIIFVVEQKPHKSFKRSNQNDLVYCHEINLRQSLTGFKFNIQTLDKRRLRISITDVVYTGYTKVIAGEGLPTCKELDVITTANESNDKGNLIIEFSIAFPRYLTKEMKIVARTFFENLKQMENKEEGFDKML